MKMDKSGKQERWYASTIIGADNLIVLGRRLNNYHESCQRLSLPSMLVGRAWGGSKRF